MRAPTDWNHYQSRPDSFVSKYLFLNFVVKAYSDLLSITNFNRPIDVLEFGCGTGFTDRWLCRRFQVKRLSLIDSNKQMLNVAKKTLADVDCDKEFIASDFFEVDCKEQYDLVHSQGVIEHFEAEDRVELLRRHCDATKSKGFCIIYFPVPSKPYRFFRKIAELLGVWVFSDEVPLPQSVVINEMKSFGFSTMKINSFWKLFLTETGIIFRKDE